jgi:hypothetical protein
MLSDMAHHFTLGLLRLTAGSTAIAVVTATSRGPRPLVGRCVITVWFCTGRILPDIIFTRLSDGRRNLQTRCSLHVEDLLVQREARLAHCVLSGRLQCEGYYHIPFCNLLHL